MPRRRLFPDGASVLRSGFGAQEDVECGGNESDFVGWNTWCGFSPSLSLDNGADLPLLTGGSSSGSICVAQTTAWCCVSIYGAVAALCEEFENHQDGPGEPEILTGRSIVLGEIKAEIPLQDENPLNHQIQWQQYMERIESLSQESKVSRFCMEAGFMRVVEMGQYFMTKDTGDFRQFQSVVCREYTLPRDDPASQPKGWIQGNMKIGLVLEVTTSFQNYKHWDRNSNLVCE